MCGLAGHTRTAVHVQVASAMGYAELILMESIRKTGGDGAGSLNPRPD